MARLSLRAVQKLTCKKRDAWWTVFLVDPVATRMLLVVARFRFITPNRVTWAALFIGLASAGFFLEGDRRSLLIGALLYHLSFILDCIDGKLARLKGNGTVFGGWLDYVFDRIRVLFCALALMGGQFLRTDDERYLLAALAVVFLDMLRYVDALQIYKMRMSMRTKIEKVTKSRAEAERVEREAQEEAERTRREAPHTHTEGTRQTGATYPGAPGRPYPAAPGRPYSADADRTYSADAGQPHLTDAGRPYSTDAGRSYSADASRTYPAESGRTYSADIDRTHPTDAGRPYSAGADRNPPTDAGRTNSAGVGRSYSADASRTYPAESGRTYSAGADRNPPTDAGRTNSADAGRSYSADASRTYPAESGRTHSADAGRPYSAAPGRPYPPDADRPHPADARHPHPTDPAQPHPSNPAQNPAEPKRPDASTTPQVVFMEDLLRDNPSSTAEALREESAANVVDLHEQFRDRFPWYMRVRRAMLHTRVRPHLISGIEFQMFVFIVGPLIGRILWTTVVSAALLMLFELVIMYKFWLSTRDFTRVMEELDPTPTTAGTIAPHLHKGRHRHGRAVTDALLEDERYRAPEPEENPFFQPYPQPQYHHLDPQEARDLREAQNLQSLQNVHQAQNPRQAQDLQAIPTPRGESPDVLTQPIRIRPFSKPTWADAGAEAEHEGRDR